jgi:cold shock protein
MTQGKVKFFNETKGWGIIKYDGDKEIFVHISNINNKRPLNEGEEVSFEIAPGNKGPMATKVEVGGGSDSDDSGDDQDFED